MLDPMKALQACEHALTIRHATLSGFDFDAKGVCPNDIALDAIGVSPDQDPTGFIDALPPEDVALALYVAFRDWCYDNEVNPMVVSVDLYAELAKARWRESVAESKRAKG